MSDEKPARWIGSVDKALIGYRWTLSDHPEPGDVGLPMDVASGWRPTLNTAVRAAVRAADRAMKLEGRQRITTVTIKDER